MTGGAQSSAGERGRNTGRHGLGVCRWQAGPSGSGREQEGAGPCGQRAGVGRGAGKNLALAGGALASAEEGVLRLRRGGADMWGRRGRCARRELVHARRWRVTAAGRCRWGHAGLARVRALALGRARGAAAVMGRPVRRSGDRGELGRGRRAATRSRAE